MALRLNRTRPHARWPLAAGLAVAVGLALPSAWWPLAAAGAGPAALQPAPDSRCFPETNQCVEGRFLAYWRSRGLDLGDSDVSERESVALFGYPISPEFTQRLEDGRDRVVQYFERARFERHPEHAPPHDVLLGQLGRQVLATVPDAPTAPAAPRAGATHFPETGHNVGPDFALFWRRNGGLAIFGYPLSEPFTQALEDGRARTVQYFERARFEQHPATEGMPYNVQLGHFGRAVLAAAPTAPAPASDNVFATILGPAAAPPLWAVRPCAGDAPFLCLLAGGERAGTVELSMGHVETLPDLQALLRRQGLAPGAIDHRDPEQAPKIAAAMRGFVEAYHTTFAEDRRATYGTTRTYARLETQPAQVGAVPGVRYGFVLTDPAGTVRERWLSFAAFDGVLLHLLVARYDPSSTFPIRPRNRGRQ